MQRRGLLGLLEDHVRRWPDDRATAARIRALVEAHSNCFDRDCMPGHITASAWILSPDRERSLLTHHRKLGRWLQLGGHADGVSDVREVALTEAREESGMARFDVIGGTLDLDVHEIPAHGDVPAHEHHDVRFLLVAAAGQEVVVSDESLDVKWFDWRELEHVIQGEEMDRMARRVRAIA